MKSPRRLPKQSVLVGVFTDNLALKAVALALSIVLFSIVHSDQDAQRSVLVDVVAILPPVNADKMLVSELPHEVRVTLRGSRSRLSELSRGEIDPIQMDLRDAQRRYYYFEPKTLEISGNVQVIAVEPATVQLIWAVRSERQIPIRPRLRGEVPEGFTVKQPVLMSPPMVSIQGPEAVVTAIREVFTEAILLDGMGPGSHDPRVPLEPLPDGVSYLDDVAVQALITIEPEISERTFRKLDVAVVGEGEANLRPDRVSVTVRGAAAVLAVIDVEQLVPYVRLSAEQQAAGTQPQDVQVRGIPDGVELVRTSPSSVLVRPRK